MSTTAVIALCIAVAVAAALGTITGGIALLLIITAPLRKDD